MSDYEDDYYYEDDDFFYFDDEPLDQVAEDAEHALPSPVIIGYEPSMDLRDNFSDWEYYSDDYYDDIGLREEWKPHSEQKKNVENEAQRIQQGKRKASNSVMGKKGTKKRRRLSDTTSIPSLSLDSGSDLDCDLSELVSTSPIVKWRTKENSGKSKPQLLDDSVVAKVSLMPDWRDRFDVPHRKEEHQASKEDALPRDKQPPKDNTRKRKARMSPPPAPLTRNTRRRRGK